MRAAIRPISVSCPVATTIARPRPHVTPVPANTIEDRSAITVSCATDAHAFVDRKRLAGQRGLVELEPLVCRDASVGGDPVPLAQHEQVTGDDLFGGDLPLVSLPNHRRRRLDRFAQCEHGAFGTRLLHETEHRVEDDDRGDDESLELLSDQERDRGRRQQQRNERIGHLPGRYRRIRGPVRHRQPIDSDFTESDDEPQALSGRAGDRLRRHGRGRRARSRATPRLLAADDASARAARCAGRSRCSFSGSARSCMGPTCSSIRRSPPADRGFRGCGGSPGASTMRTTTNWGPKEVTMKTILVGYDETEPAKRALARAAELAAAFEAKVIVTSVAQVLAGAAAARGVGPIDPVDTPELHREELRHAAAFLEERGIQAEYTVALGDPAKVILDLAESPQRGSDRRRHARGRPARAVARPECQRCCGAQGALRCPCRPLRHGAERQRAARRAALSPRNRAYRAG